ncbi:hypothetical protein QBC44DRAFT_46197 [Cladorrhinum sp. PSN332]|nr:hypothetical protein QBC44DRAFT_46197 [Cladorrhinum sp. PSN332]
MPGVVYTSGSFVEDLDGVEIVVVPSPSLVSLPPGLIKRFYATTILQNTLDSTIIQTQKKTPSDVDDTTSWSDDKNIFRRFVNRLAHVCDSRPRGDTVTAVAILVPGSIEYRLTSNQRSSGAYAEVKQYLSEQVLGLLRDASDEALNNRARISALSSAILLNVLRFTRRRVKCYVSLLVTHIGFCIEWCESDGSAEAILASTALFSIQEIAQETMNSWPDPEEFAAQSRTLLATIKAHKPALGSLLRLKVAHSGLGSASSTSWTEIHHAIGRLDSYSIAVKGIVDARKRWPMLFASFEVTTVPSRPRHPNPINLKHSACNAKHILSSLNKADQKVVAAYEDFFVQTLSMDDQIREEIKDPNYNTLVHAEVNLLDNIYRSHIDPDNETGAARFFDERRFGRYIGGSKQTCMLCNLFFEAHPLRVDRRDSHGTLYAKWRAPDVFVEDSHELAETRRKVVYQMADEMKKIVSMGILDRTGGGRKYDSRHETTDPLRTIGSVSLRGSVQVDDGLSTVGVVGGNRPMGGNGASSSYLLAQMGSSTTTAEGGSATDDLSMAMEDLNIRHGSQAEHLNGPSWTKEEKGGFSDGDDDIDGGARL